MATPIFLRSATPRDPPLSAWVWATSRGEATGCWRAKAERVRELSKGEKIPLISVLPRGVAAGWTWEEEVGWAEEEEWVEEEVGWAEEEVEWVEEEVGWAEEEVEWVEKEVGWAEEEVGVVMGEEVFGWEDEDEARWGCEWVVVVARGWVEEATVEGVCSIVVVGGAAAAAALVVMGVIRLGSIGLNIPGNSFTTFHGTSV